VDTGGGQRLFLAIPIFLVLAHFFLNAQGLRFPPSGFRFQPFSLSAFQLLPEQVSACQLFSMSAFDLRVIASREDRL